jgi:hypothetical protein
MLLLPTTAMVLGALGLMTWRSPTDVALELSIARTTFTLGGGDATTLVNSVPVRSVTIERFARATLTPTRLEALSPATRTAPPRGGREAGWRPLALAPPVEITPGDDALQPALTFESSTDGATTNGVFGPLRINPGAEVTIEARSPTTPDPSISVAGQSCSAVLSFTGPFHLTANHVKVAGVAGAPAETSTYRGILPPESRFVEIVSKPHAFVVSLTIESGPATTVFPKGIQITAVSFDRQGVDGRRETSLTGPGEISYPGYPGVPNVRVEASHFVTLRDVSGFRIDDIATAADARGLRIRLSGTAGGLTTGAPDAPADRRLTRFDALWQNSRLLTLFAIAVWALSTTIGGYQLVKDLRA